MSKLLNGSCLKKIYICPIPWDKYEGSFFKNNQTAHRCATLRNPKVIKNVSYSFNFKPKIHSKHPSAFSDQCSSIISSLNSLWVPKKQFKETDCFEIWPQLSQDWQNRLGCVLNGIANFLFTSFNFLSKFNLNFKAMLCRNSSKFVERASLCTPACNMVTGGEKVVQKSLNGSMDVFWQALDKALDKPDLCC